MKKLSEKNVKNPVVEQQEDSSPDFEKYFEDWLKQWGNIEHIN